MKDNDREDTLKQFFQHHPTDDTFYLKNYVKQHPDNKMAWYFLGRDYESKGYRKKALYCFTQAGEVYEAFEAEALPHILSPSDQGALHNNRRKQRWKAVRRIAVLILLLLLSSIPDNPFSLPDSDVPSRHAGSPVHPHVASIAQISEREQEQPVTSGSILYQGDIEYTSIKQANIYYLSDRDDHRGLGQALRQLTLPERLMESDSVDYSLVVKPAFSPDQRWRQWLGSTRILLEARHNIDRGLIIHYLDQEICQCEPGSAHIAHQWLLDWKLKQESELVLRSAIYAYAQENGELPIAIQDLNQPYPNNRISGYTSYMEERFESSLMVVTEWLQEKSLSHSETSSDEAVEQRLAATHSLLLLDPLSKPLEIVIDKNNHRLALVSGDVILRSYPVGLGGNRTPDGEFIISEKVKNPNGRSDGEFGSRGMTLSDTLYAIHGTNQPDSIGQDVSLGCIRMNNADVGELFAMVPLGTRVVIGENLIPDAIWNPSVPFELPSMVNEENPHKTYHWLN